MARPRSAAGRCRRTHEELKTVFPEAECELNFQNAFQLLTATILSAQATDISVNKATPLLFKKYPSPEALAEAEIPDIEECVRTIGLYRSKAKNLQGMARKLITEFGGSVPESMSDLVSLPGVGRKTANVVRSVALGLPGLPVDTHVSRLVSRLEITQETDPVKIEKEISPMLPSSERGEFSLSYTSRKTCVFR